MKKIFLILVIFLIISQVNAVEINGVDFEIPEKYSGGDLKPYGYIFNDENDFSIFCVDFLMDTNYAEWVCECPFSENITINSHDAIHYVTKDNVSHLYYPIYNSTFCISWNSSEITPEIEKLVSDSPQSNLSFSQFHHKLELELFNYIMDQELSEEVVFRGDFDWDDYDYDYVWS